MLLLVILLIPGVLGAKNEYTLDNYKVTTENGLLMKVTQTEKSSGTLDLSDLRIDKIAVDCFEGLKGLKKLTIHLTTTEEGYPQDGLQPLVFRELSELENLTLVATNIKDLKWVFWGLKNLGLLDLTKSSFHLELGSFFGLKNNGIIKLPPHKEQKLEAEYFEEPFPFVCVQMINGIVESVETLDETIKINTSPYDVRMIPLRFEILTLDKMGIKGFAEGWYRIKNKTVRSLSLMRNNIKRLTSQMFTGLSTNISEMYVASNKIKKIKRGIIVNSHLRKLDLYGNPLVSIEPYAFNNTQLEKIVLSFDFMTTLPASLQNLEFIGISEKYDITCVSGRGN